MTLRQSTKDGGIYIGEITRNIKSGTNISFQFAAPGLFLTLNLSFNIGNWSSHYDYTVNPLLHMLYLDSSILKVYDEYEDYLGETKHDDWTK